jgi:hypothetical protein
MTRYLLTFDPGAAAHSAKNEIAVPGLPNQPAMNSKGRNAMVDAAGTPDTSGKTVAQQQIAGLLALAAMIERHPEIAEHLRFPLRQLHTPLTSRDEDPRGTLEAFAVCRGGDAARR